MVKIKNAPPSYYSTQFKIRSMAESRSIKKKEKEQEKTIEIKQQQKQQEIKKLDLGYLELK